MNDWTDDEREFARGHRGSVLAALTGEDTPKHEATRAAAELVHVLAHRFPNRCERLLILAVVADLFTDHRDALVAELIADRVGDPVRNVHSGDWVGLALQPYEVEWLASLAGVSPATIRRRAREHWTTSLRAAMVAAGEDPDA